MKMKLELIILCICLFALVSSKSAKKSSRSNPQPAIIAIQIIDPEEKSSKSSKRTIESSLGYGYQNPPKYEVYKYSQHDIPPYKISTAQSDGGINFRTPTIDNSIQPSQIQGETVLFSSIDQHGQLGELSPQLPNVHQNQQFPVPVIILRVHPNQLSSPLYPNLPPSHLHSSSINSIDITSLLSNYNGNMLKNTDTNTNSQPSYQTSNSYYVPNHIEYQLQDYQSQRTHPEEYDGQSNAQQAQYTNYQQPQTYQQSSGYSPTELLTDENFPSEKHTRIIFNTGKGKQRHVNDSHKVRAKYATIPVSEENHHQYESRIENSHENSEINDQGQYSYSNQQYFHDNAPQYKETEERRVPERHQDVYVQKSRQIYIPQEQSQRTLKAS